MARNILVAIVEPLDLAEIIAIWKNFQKTSKGMI